MYLESGQQVKLGYEREESGTTSEKIILRVYTEMIVQVHEGSMGKQETGRTKSQARAHNIWKLYHIEKTDMAQNCWSTGFSGKDE